MKNYIRIIRYFILALVFTSILHAQLNNNNNQADYLIITVSKFDSTLQNFIQWRSKNGLELKLVNVNEIYQEFPDSTKHNSIRDFISYSLENWQNPKPQYVLLVGDGSDIPSFYVRSQFANDTVWHEDSVSIDEWYSINLYQKDTEPDIALGRWPVANNNELANIISKTISFQDSLKHASYPQDFIILTDIQDSSIFNSSANQFISSVTAGKYSVKRIFGNSYPGVESIRKTLFNDLNTGCLFLSYYGHGAPALWSRYHIFTSKDIDSLKVNNLPFIYTAAACSQSFDLPGDSSIVDKFLSAPGKGAVATIASTGLNLLSTGTNFLQEFYSILFSNPNLTIGQVFLKTKEHFYSNSMPNDYFYRRFTLLGDPALKLPKNVVSEIRNQNITIPRNYSLAQNYPNPFNPSTTIQYKIANYGYVSIKVYDVLGKEIKTLISKEKSPGTYSISFNASNLSSGVYFYRMQVTSSSGIIIYSSVQKMIVLK